MVSTSPVPVEWPARSVAPRVTAEAVQAAFAENRHIESQASALRAAQSQMALAIAQVETMRRP